MEFTKTQYAGFKRRNKRYEEWSKQFLKPNGWAVIPANEKPPVKITNEERSACEVYEWRRDKPKNYFAYVDTKTQRLTTWTGQNLGKIDFGYCYTSNFGDIRQSVLIWANNGKKYQGTFYKSAGDYCRIRQVK